jgi:hypothetical protein
MASALFTGDWLVHDQRGADVTSVVAEDIADRGSRCPCLATRGYRGGSCDAAGMVDVTKQ